MLIGVIDGNGAEGEALTIAREVGREIASRGHVLVCGGRGGVMHEACRGANEAGGLTVGILPSDDLADANEFLDIPVITGIGFARTSIVARTANALIAIDGSYGTLSEIAFGLTAGRHIVGLRTWELRDGAGREPPIERVGSAVDARERAAPGG